MTGGVIGGADELQAYASNLSHAYVKAGPGFLLVPKSRAILFPEQNSTSNPEEFPNSRRTETEANSKMTAPRCRARSSIRSSTREEQAREVQDAYTAEECSGTARSLWICDIATTTKPVYSVNVSCCISRTKNTEAEGAIFLSIRYLDLQVYSLQSFTYHRATGRNMVHTNRRNEAATMDFQDFRLQIPRPIIAPCLGSQL